MRANEHMVGLYIAYQSWCDPHASNSSTVIEIRKKIFDAILFNCYKLKIQKWSVKDTLLLSEISCLSEPTLKMSGYPWEIHIPLLSGNMVYHSVLHTIRLWQLFPQQAVVGIVKGWNIVVNSKTEITVALPTSRGQWGRCHMVSVIKFFSPGLCFFGLSLAHSKGSICLYPTSPQSNHFY